MNNSPETLSELRRFYFDEFTPLYNRFQNAHRVPQEINAEVAAALDHLLCDRSESGDRAFSEDAIRRAAGHLKRATFDGFKVVFDEEVRKPRERFMDSRYADVNDGEFQPKVEALWAEAKAVCAEARTLERKSRASGPESWDAAFRRWNDILKYADEFDKLSKKPEVARAHGVSTRRRVLSVVWQIALVVLGWLLSRYFG